MAAASKTTGSSGLREKSSEAPGRDPAWAQFLYGLEAEETSSAAFSDDQKHIPPKTGLAAITIAGDSVIIVTANVFSI